MASLVMVILVVALAAPLNAMLMPVQMFKTCLGTVKVDCPCGRNGDVVSIKVEECLVVDAAIHPGVVSHCQPCSMTETSYDPCDNFASCDKCDPTGQGCMSCPPGLTGKFCDKPNGSDGYYGEMYPGQYVPEPLGPSGNENAIENMELPPMGQDMMRDHFLHYEQKRDAVFPIELTIPAGGGSQDPNARLVRSLSSCKLPEYLDTAELKCAIWPTYVKCNLSCIWGHVLPNGKSMALKCRNRENTWKPEGFRECSPYVDCSVKLVSPGALGCVSNFISEPARCDINCDEYDDIPEVPKRTYTCTLQGGFDPPLPFCAVKANVTQTVQPPSW